MNRQQLLHTGTSPSAGAARTMAERTALLQASLTGTGGTAAGNVYGRMPGGPWKVLWTWSLSGANDRVEYVLDSEPWAELYADISSIAGGAVASVWAGY